MDKFIKTTLIISVFVLLCMTGTASSEDEFVILLVQAKGKVVYSIDGKTWENVRRNKFLYDGYRVKTGDDGFCKLIDQKTEMVQTMKNNTEIEIRSDGIKALRGTISKAKPAKSLSGFLKRKFAKVQKYTMVQRYGKNGGQIKLKTVRDITLSKDYPDLVWENVGPEYSYQIIVGEKVFDVPTSCEPEIRFRLTETEPGSRLDYHVQVLYKGVILYAPENKGSLRWLSDAETESLRKGKQAVEQIAPDNGFLMGNFMDEQGLKVAAMDYYRKFMARNPDANEARPFLIKVYHDLRLKKQKQAEVVLYHE